MLKTSINLGGKATLTRQVITCAKTNQRKPAGGGFGKSSKPAEKDQKASLEGSTVSDQVESSSDFSPPPEFAPSSPSNNSANSPSTSNEALPSVSRDQILATCLQTSALIAVAAVGLHQLAPLIAPAMKDGNADTVQSLLNWTALPSVQDLGIAAGTASAVTLARLALLSALPDFKSASDRSNQQVLNPLQGPLDLVAVSALPGISEELLFRGALIPAIYPDWKGAVISGLVFGALHVNGGRNLTFAAWASLVGCIYGAALLVTGHVATPVIAHSLANVAASALWLQQRNSQ